jgi:hypothetical protein
MVDCIIKNAPCYDLESLRHCDRFGSFPVGNRTAFQCVDYGSGAAVCHWTGYVLLDRRMVRIMSDASEAAVFRETLTLNFASWNQLNEWLRQIERLRRAA